MFVVGGAFRWAQALVAVFAIGALAAQLLVAARPRPDLAARRRPRPRSRAHCDLADPAAGRAARATRSGRRRVARRRRLAARPVTVARANARRTGFAAGARLLLDLARNRDPCAEDVDVGARPLSGGRDGRCLCGLTAVVVGVHELFGITRLYGIYEVAHARPNVLGPLLNENHLGELMALGTCVAIGLVMYRRQRSWLRVTWMLVVVACGAATAASYSRGSIIAMPIGALVTGGVLLGQRFAAPETGARRRRRKFATSSLPIVVVAACVVVVVVYSSAGRVSDKLGRTTLDDVQHTGSKFMVWKSATKLIEESPWVGVGRGGFESSLTRVHPASGSVTFAYAENEYVQAVVDWGIPGALALGLVLLWFASVAIRRWRDGPLVAGAIGGLAAIAVQNNVDFGMELLGVSAPVIAIAATLAYVPLREEAGRVLARLATLWLRMAARRVWRRAALVAIADHHHDRGGSRADSPSITRDRRRTGRARSPSARLLRLRASPPRMITRTSDPRSIRLLNHAMRLHPTHPDLHRTAARLLLRGGHFDQAAIEYAAAIARDRRSHSD